MLSTQEVIRVRRNIHPGLPWETTANHLNDFSKRLRLSGYNQDYRYQIIKSGVEGFEKMKDVASQGGRPINSPRTWEEDLRQKKKYFKKKTWFKKGGFDVPLFVPHTPRGELAKRMRRKEGENNQGRKIRFRIVEKGGITLEQKLRRSNPWSKENCGRIRCFPCKSEGGGNCYRESVTYTIFCEECGIEVAAYIGETGRNGFSRGCEHWDNLDGKDEEKSILWRHSNTDHQAREDIVYTMKVTGGYSEPLDRQLMERIKISNFGGPSLMNRRNEMGGLRVERTKYRRWGGD